MKFLSLLSQLNDDELMSCGAAVANIPQNNEDRLIGNQLELELYTKRIKDVVSKLLLKREHILQKQIKKTKNNITYYECTTQVSLPIQFSPEQVISLVFRSFSKYCADNKIDSSSCIQTLRDHIAPLIFNEFDHFINEKDYVTSNKNEQLTILLTYLVLLIRMLPHGSALSIFSFRSQIKSFQYIKNMLLEQTLLSLPLTQITSNLQVDKVESLKRQDAEFVSHAKNLMNFFQIYMDKFKEVNMEWLIYLESFKDKNEPILISKIDLALIYGKELQKKIKNYEICNNKLQLQTVINHQTAQQVRKIYDEIYEAYRNYTLALFPLFDEKDVWCINDFFLNDLLNHKTFEKCNEENNDKDVKENELSYIKTWLFQKSLREFLFVFCNFNTAYLDYIFEQLKLPFIENLVRREQVWQKPIDEIMQEIALLSSKKKCGRYPPFLRSKKNKKRLKPTSTKSKNVHEEFLKSVTLGASTLKEASLKTEKKNTDISYIPKLVQKKARRHSNKQLVKKTENRSFSFPVSENAKKIPVKEAEEETIFSDVDTSLSNYTQTNCTEFAKLQPLICETLLRRDSHVVNQIFNQFEEFKLHFIYTQIGMQEFIKAVKTQSFSQLGVVIPFIISSLFAQQERLLNILILKSGRLISEHHLIINAQNTDILDQLSKISQDCLHQMDLATFWFRYANNSKNLYEKHGWKVTRGLSLILFSQYLMKQKSLTASKIKRRLIDFLQFYNQNIHLIDELLNLNQPDSQSLLKSKVQEKLVKTIDVLANKMSVDRHINKNQLVELKENFKNYSEKLNDLQERIYSKEIGDNKEIPDKIKSYLKDVKMHINRINMNIQIYAQNENEHACGWIIRNFMNSFQMSFEILYIVRYYNKNFDLKFSHDLLQFHRLLGDEENLNPESFSFDKFLQSPSSRPHNEKAALLYDYQRVLQEQINHQINQENISSKNYLESFDKEVSDLLNHGMTLLELHVNACLESFSPDYLA